MKVGIIGAGTIAREVVPQMPGWGIQPVALCGTRRSEKAVREFAEANGISRIYFEYGEMLQNQDVEAVYIATPNVLHYSQALEALEAGKHVIVEKPMTSNVGEARHLAAVAREKGLYLFEAISTVYLPNYKKIQEWLPRIGTIKIVSCNYSQYSRRYDAFLAGDVKPAFDPAQSGGCLMDINLYNVHYLLGLFGEPETVQYMANVDRGIDTSGVLTLDYGAWKAVSIAAKDCSAPCQYVIQGTKGYISQDTPANFCQKVRIHLNDGTEEVWEETPDSRLEPEFKAFVRMMETHDRAEWEEHLNHSLKVAEVLTAARKDAGIHFPADEGWNA